MRSGLLHGHGGAGRELERCELLLALAPSSGARAPSLMRARHSPRRAGSRARPPSRGCSLLRHSGTRARSAARGFRPAPTSTSWRCSRRRSRRSVRNAAPSAPSCSRDSHSSCTTRPRCSAASHSARRPSQRVTRGRSSSRCTAATGRRSGPTASASAAAPPIACSTGADSTAANARPARRTVLERTGDVWRAGFEPDVTLLKDRTVCATWRPCWPRPARSSARSSSRGTSPPAMAQRRVPPSTRAST